MRTRFTLGIFAAMVAGSCIQALCLFFMLPGTSVVPLAIAALAGVSVSLAASALTIRSLVDLPLKRIVARLRSLAEGDLVSRIGRVRAHGGLEEAARELDETLAGNYQVILLGLDELASRNLADARGFSADISSAIGVIDSAREPIDSMGSKVSSLSERISDASAEASQVSTAVKRLGERVADQAGAVEQTGAVIEETSGQIRSIADTANRERASAANLADVVERGGKGVDAVVAVMDGLQTGVAEIAELSKMINQVASRTNLLAMNAAIEAAHAGEYGRGFAVVAEEIRNLAESAGTGSKRIAKSLSEFTGRIGAAAKANKELKELFSGLHSDSERFIAAFSGISDGTSEIASGTAQMVEGVQELRAISIENRTAFDDMGRSVSALDALFDETARLAHSLGDDGAAMSKAFGEAAGRVETLGKKGQESQRSFEELATELRYFSLDASVEHASYRPEIKRIIFDHKRRVVDSKLFLDGRVPLANLPAPCGAADCLLDPLLKEIGPRLPERAARLAELDVAHHAFHEAYNAFQLACGKSAADSSGQTIRDRLGPLLAETERRWTALFDYREELNQLLGKLDTDRA